MNKYIFSINGDSFIAYGLSENMAKKIMIRACSKYCSCGDERMRSFWNDIHKSLIEGNYEVIEESYTKKKEFPLCM